jgi:hypothetical protein
MVDIDEQQQSLALAAASQRLYMCEQVLLRCLWLQQHFAYGFPCLFIGSYLVTKGANADCCAGARNALHDRRDE